ncbi:kin of IRRE-like protein 2, partial [Hetaerina americana]|uniref:kin of IRRE-like protein 2 n=1 Tax=Hetaerina americana TaxID=62018 RepID=UPI003A7F10BC
IEKLEAVQRFEQQPEYTEVDPGDDAKLACRVSNKRGHCSWQKDNKPVGIYIRKYEWVSPESAIGTDGAMGGGDCSIWVRNAAMEFDDGEWECQVTASDFASQDALTSNPVHLVVRVAPQRPRLEFNGSNVGGGEAPGPSEPGSPPANVTATSGEKGSLACISRFGNPPPVLKWFIDDEEIPSKSNQTNAREAENPRTWSSTSRLSLRFDRTHHGRRIRCVALHAAYPAGSTASAAALDIRYPPEVRLLGAPLADVEEGRDAVSLQCSADGNPTPGVVWRRIGGLPSVASRRDSYGTISVVSSASNVGDVVGLEPTLSFHPAMRSHSGTYTCEARNVLGASQPLSVMLDVKFPPSILRVGPERVTTAALYSEVEFECEAEGNPPPSFRWLQKLSSGLPFGTMQGGDPGGVVVVRGSESRLLLKNVTYEHQGELVCVATNVIGGEERAVQSEPISIQVVGGPQVLRRSSQTGGQNSLGNYNSWLLTSGAAHDGRGEEEELVAVPTGSMAEMRLVVCADPHPRAVAWEWGSVRLEAGDQPMGRFHAHPLVPSDREDCYVAMLTVNQVDQEDARSYHLSVENDRGADRHSIRLLVRDPVPFFTLVTIGAGLGLLLLVVIISTIIAFRREKCCFARRGDFRPTDLESEAGSEVLTGRQPLGTKSPQAPFDTSRRQGGPGIGTQGGSPAAGGGFSTPEAVKKQPRGSWGGEYLGTMVIGDRRGYAGRADWTYGNLYADLQYPRTSNNGSTRICPTVGPGGRMAGYRPSTNDRADI